MGIFTRLRDIISSNINAMLDKAEDPEKLVKLMIQEMEDTLVEIKAACAGSMASSREVERARELAEERADRWAENARLAVDKGRDDLAREALLEKRRYEDRVAALDEELAGHEAVVAQYQDDIMQLEEKLSQARDRQRVLVQRHVRAQKRKKAQRGIRRIDTTDAWLRFEQFEKRIDRMEAEADLVNYGRKPTLDDRFAELAADDEIEEQLRELKADGASPAEKAGE